MKKLILIASFFIITNSFCQKKEIIVVHRDSLISMEGYTDYYVDKTRKLSFDDVKNKSFLSLKKPPLNIQAITWYTIKILPKVKTKYLIITPHVVDDSDFYIPQIKGYVKYNCGSYSKNKRIKYDTSDASIIKLETKTIDFSKPFYFNKKPLYKNGLHSLKKDGYLLFSNSKDNWHNSNVINYSNTNDYQIFIAVIFLAALLFLVNFLVLKDRNFLNYSFYLFFTSFIFIPTFPVFHNFFNMIHPRTGAYIEMFSIVMTATTYFYFVVKFIEVKESFLKIYRLAKYTILFSFLFAILELILVIFFPYFKYRFVIHNYFNYTYLIISIAVFIYLISKKLSLLKRFVILGSLFLILGQSLSLIFGNPFYFLGAVLIEIILFSIVVSLQNKHLAIREVKNQIDFNNEKQKKENLIKLSKLKSNFFTNISHEFRTPLTLISGPIQKQLKKQNLKEEDIQDFKMIQRNSNRLLTLVDQLLDISKLESGSLKLKVLKTKAIPFIGNLIDGFSFKAKQKKIDFIINTNNTNKNTWVDKDAIEKIITNLLSNAIKYTPENGTIICNTFIEDDKLVFEVKNSGKGLTEKELRKVFKRFYQTNNVSEGVGIGLALVKELVTLHRGKITVESSENKWTVFKIVLPINKVSFKEDEIVLIPSNFDQNLIKEEALYKTENQESTDLNNEMPILLIVEDNTDVRTYVSSIFSDTYSILQAKNGQEGIDLAIKHIPDIIISDIMMPIKDGIELCNTLKVDERTSHIPIILLTAKAGEENEIKGVKIGADDYITKPFNEDLLKLKVEKRIEIRKKLQERFSQEVILKPVDVAINSIDQLFLERLQTVLDDNLLESSFNTKEFCNAVSMSRMQLHRKIKALFGMSTSEFIRSQRLKLAADLLKKSDINVSQVGYSVGFNDHAYFSKRFKEVYNCTPSEYANSKN
ncbi:MAG: response regulator [Flavobacteriaceae bacterium]